MAITSVKVAEVINAYRDWLGEPIRVLRFKRAEENDQIPTELSVLLFEPANNDELPDAKRFCYLATAGMSTRTNDGPNERVELMLRVDGRHDAKDLERLGEFLSRVAIVPFIENMPLGPNQIFSDIPWPLFSQMNCALITRWAVRSDKWLHNAEPLALLLSIIPIHQAEADVIRIIGDIEANRRFLDEDINWNDPRRIRASLLLPLAGVDLQRTERSMGVTAMSGSINQTWNQIEEWHRQSAPDALDEFAAGATDQEIKALETGVGVTLPADYQSSLRRHNGGGRLHNYNYLSTAQVIRSWQLMDQLKKDGAFDDQQLEDQDGNFQKTWWHSHWIPVAEHKSGSLICIDLAPTEKGVPGQILRVETHYDGPSATKYNSFLEWLIAYKDDLLKGSYEVDEHGNLDPRSGSV